MLAVTEEGIELVIGDTVASPLTGEPVRIERIVREAAPWVRVEYEDGSMQFYEVQFLHSRAYRAPNGRFEIAEKKQKEQKVKSAGA